jgi:hypothetical protein
MKPTIPRPIPWIAVAMLLATMLTACQSWPPRTPTDLDLLQGYWEGHGPGGPCSVTLSDDALYFRAREDFWFETRFTLPEATGPKQLHATITDESSPEKENVGTVVVTLFEVEGEKLTLGVVEDFEGPPTSPIVGDWDWIFDIYELERAR